jgi:hypothetical protein
MPKEPETVQRPSATLIPYKAPSYKKSSKTGKPVISRETRDDKRRKSRGSSADKNGTRDKSPSRFTSSSKHGRKKNHDKNKESVSKVGAMATDSKDKHRRVSELDSGPPGKPADRIYSSGRVDEEDPFLVIKEMGAPFAKVYSPLPSATDPHPLDDIYCYSPTSPSYSPTSPTNQQYGETELGDVTFHVHRKTFAEYPDRFLTFRSASLEDSFEDSLQVGESTLKDDAGISSRILSRLTPPRQEEEEEEVDELLREWTTVFH